MNKLDKKLPFKEPENYFNNFYKKLEKKIESINSYNGFSTPKNYFQKIENQIQNQFYNRNEESPSHSNYIYKVIAVAGILVVFFINEKTTDNSINLADFFIEDYLMVNSTYEIAEHSDYSFEIGNFIENYESIAIDHALEITLYGETPTNLDLFNDE